MAQWSWLFLDSRQGAGPWCLMAVLRVICMIWLVAGVAISCLAQTASPAGSKPSQTNQSSPVVVHTNATAEPALSATPSALITVPDLDLKPAEPAAEISVGKKWRIGGPLISIFKPGNLRQAPGRFFRLINPFHRSTEEVATMSEVEYENYQGLSARPWAATVGWHPTHSSLADPVTHEGGISLLNFGRAGD